MAKTEPTTDAAGKPLEGKAPSALPEASFDMGETASAALPKDAAAKSSSAEILGPKVVSPEAKPADAKPASSSTAPSLPEDVPPITVREPLWGKETAEPAKPADDKPQSSPIPELDLPPATAPAPRRSAAPMLLAGIVTAGLGLGAGYAIWGPNGFLAGQSQIETRLAALEGQLLAVTGGTKTTASAAASAAAEPLGARIAATESALADLPALSEAVASLRGQSQQSAESLAALDAKLTELAQRPPASDSAAVAAYERELSALRGTFETQLAQIKAGSDQVLAEIRGSLGSELDRIEAESKAAAAASEQSAALQAEAERAAALAALNAALDSGTSLAEPLARVAAAAPEAPLAALQSHAEGIPTLLALQEAFPEAARAALSAQSHAGAGEGGLGGALKGFLGMRSLAPQEGSSTDAVLSRAEAALAAGDLPRALSELDGLAGAPAEALKSWRTDAARRLAALDAYKTLSDAMEK